MRAAPALSRPAPVAALVCALLVGCGGGGGDSLTPNDPFPNAAGSYQMEGGFDGLSREQASFTGILTLTQASRQSGTLGGSVSLSLRVNGSRSSASSPIESASVSTSGEVAFRLGSATDDATWTFHGTLAGSSISGRHTLSDGSQAFPGNWSATTGGAATGSVTVVVTTNGSSPDPDGYTIALDGVDRGSIGRDASRTFSELAPGTHTIGLSGVADNCQVEGNNPRTVVVDAAGSATVRYSVTCVTSSAGSGTLRITAFTSGSELDPDGYTVTLDGSSFWSLSRGGSLTLDGVPAGNHLVALSGVAANCTVQGENPRVVSIQAGTTSTAAFDIICNAPQPSTGAIRITTVTTGPAQDPTGYLLSTDGGASQLIGSNASITMVSVAAGPHTIGLSDVAANCSVQGANPQIVGVTAGATTDVLFAVNCTQTLASTTTVITDDSPDPSIPREVVTVTFRVTSSSGIPSGIVVVTASGGRATCAATLRDDGQGSCQLTDLVNTGQRTLSATYQGDGQFASSVGQALHTVQE